MKNYKPSKRNVSEKLRTSKGKAKFLEKGTTTSRAKKSLFSPHTHISDKEL
jgi:hypothetical protein